MFVRSRGLTYQWNLLLREIRTVSKEQTSIKLLLRDNTVGPTIPVECHSDGSFLYEMIGLEVKQFDQNISKRPTSTAD